MFCVMYRRDPVIPTPLWEIYRSKAIRFPRIRAVAAITAAGTPQTPPSRSQNLKAASWESSNLAGIRNRTNGAFVDGYSFRFRVAFAAGFKVVLAARVRME